MGDYFSQEVEVAGLGYHSRVDPDTAHIHDQRGDVQGLVDPILQNCTLIYADIRV